MLPPTIGCPPANADGSDDKSYRGPEIDEKIRRAIAPGHRAPRFRDGSIAAHGGRRASRDASTASPVAVSLKPFVGYFINPDNYYNPFQRKRPKDGVEAGLFLSVALGRLLGTSQKPL